MELIKVKEAAKLIKVKPQTFYVMINEPECDIPVVRLGKRIVRIDRDGFIEWINKRKKGGAV